MKKLRKAVLPVAGLGTRFLPATKALAKEMLPVVDKPLIQYAIEEARSAGIEQFCLVTGRGKTALIDHFDVAYELESTLRERGKTEMLEMLDGMKVPPGSITTVRQQVPLGLGHAIWCARAFIGDDPFAILLPDDLVLSETPCLKQLADAYAETGGNVVAVAEVPRDQTYKYGILSIGDDDGQLRLGREGDPGGAVGVGGVQGLGAQQGLDQGVQPLPVGPQGLQGLVVALVEDAAGLGLDQLLGGRRGPVAAQAEGIGVDPTAPGIPDRHSRPPRFRSTVSATTASQPAPASATTRGEPSEPTS